MTPRKQSDRGFTLVEIIITLTIVGVMGALYFTYAQQIRHSPLPSVRYTQSLALQQVMVNMYVNKKLFFPTKLKQFADTIGAEGTSQNNSYGVYQVVENRFIEFNNYVQISAPNQQSADNSRWKVTIKNDQGGSLSIILTH